MIRFYHDMDLLKKYLLPASLLLLVIALLIGNRLGFTFAGGKGFQRPLYFVTDEQSYPRGSTIETSAGEWRLISNASLFIWMDENSTLVVNILMNDIVEFTLIRGRIVALDKTSSNRATTILAGATITTLANEPISIVNYDFLDKVDVFPVDTTLTSTGAAKDFYAWVQSSND